MKLLDFIRGVLDTPWLQVVPVVIFILAAIYVKALEKSGVLLDYRHIKRNNRARGWSVIMAIVVGGTALLAEHYGQSWWLSLLALLLLMFSVSFVLIANRTWTANLLVGAAYLLALGYHLSAFAGMQHYQNAVRLASALSLIGAVLCLGVFAWILKRMLTPEDRRPIRVRAHTR